VEDVFCSRFLQYWQFWYTDDNRKAKNYEDRVHSVGSFHTVEDFWSTYSHMKRAHKLPIGCDYHLFDKGIRPMWEDPSNKSGGKWLIRLKKGVLQLLWERLLLAIVGGQFVTEELSSHEITGCVASVRSGEDVISIWNRDSRNEIVKEAIKRKFVEVLGVPENTVIEYRTHDASLAHSVKVENHV
jgi:translation initiation factor 4E